MTCGTRSAYVHGCRCEDCSKANAAYITEWRHRTGRTDPSRNTPPSHGIAAYQSGRCRCEVCTAANTAAQRRYRQRRQLAASPSAASSSDGKETRP